MNKLIEIIKSCWVGVLKFMAVVAFITASYAFFSNLVTTSELNAAKSEIIQTMDLDRYIYRLDNVNDNLIKTSILLETRKSKSLQKTYDALIREKLKLQKAIDDILKGKKR